MARIGASGSSHASAPLPSCGPFVFAAAFSCCAARASGLAFSENSVSCRKRAASAASCGAFFSPCSRGAEKSCSSCAKRPGASCGAPPSPCSSCDRNNCRREASSCPSSPCGDGAALFCGGCMAAFCACGAGHCDPCAACGMAASAESNGARDGTEGAASSRRMSKISINAP